MKLRPSIRIPGNIPFRRNKTTEDIPPPESFVISPSQSPSIVANRRNSGELQQSRTRLRGPRDHPSRRQVMSLYIPTGADLSSHFNTETRPSPILSSPLRIQKPSYKAPIYNIPIELLAEIFILCLPTCPEEDSSFSFSLTEAPLSLMSVCEIWRSVALNTPRLWNQLRIVLPLSDYVRLEREQVQAIELCLKRSGSLPLCVSLTHTTQSPRRSRQQNHSETSQLLISRLMAHAPRIAELSICSLHCLHELHHYIQTHAEAGHLSNLSSLCMRIGLPDYLTQDEVLCDFMSQMQTNVPALRKLAIEDMWSKVARYLTRQHCWSRNITHITLTTSCPSRDSGYRENGLGAADILSILSENPQIQSFHGVVTLNNLVPFRTTVTDLPCLVDFSIRFDIPMQDFMHGFPDPDSDIHNLFRFISCPSLETLSVAYSGLPSLSEVPFIHWLESQHLKNLRVLKLEVAMTPVALTECLLQLPPSLLALEVIDRGNICMDNNHLLFGHTVNDSHLKLLSKVDTHSRASKLLPDNYSQNLPCPHLQSFQLRLSGFLVEDYYTDPSLHSNSAVGKGVTYEVAKEFIASRTGKGLTSRLHFVEGARRNLREFQVSFSGPFSF